MGKHVVSGRDESVRLFQNPVLEYFSHIHPATPVVVFVPLIAWMAWNAAASLPAMSFIVSMVWGLALWTMAEYVIHRWAFHRQPSSQIGRRLHFLVHGIHHAYPRDSTRLVMPPLVSLPLAGLFYVVFAALFAPYHASVWAGFVSGYVAYDMIHYAIHHRNMTSPLGRYLQRHHMHHHFVNPDRAFGVSNPIWDSIFATKPEIAKRESARRRKLKQFLQRQTTNGTQHIRNSQRRKGSSL
ncbi:MAG: sterol desaturase family protein [Ignavibacteria bacterium]|jgi:sterol desaturase/sphingolipid hydroxylase (fatty acid hydroxylase superfamily)